LTIENRATGDGGERDRQARMIDTAEELGKHIGVSKVARRWEFRGAACTGRASRSDRLRRG